MSDETEQPAIRIALFNGPRVTVGDTEVARFPTHFAAALLTLLALNPAKRHDRDDLAETLWPDEDPADTRHRLREHLYQLRGSIPAGRELIQSNRQQIWLTGVESVDALEFDRLIRQARVSPSPLLPLSPSALAQAVALYSGPFAPALDCARIDDLRRRYEQDYFESLRTLTGLLAATDTARAIAYAERAVHVDPLAEAAHEDLIRLYANANRPEDARRQLRTFATQVKETGKAPSPGITAFVRSLPTDGESPDRKPDHPLVRPGPLTLSRITYAFPRSALLVAPALLLLAAIIVLQTWRRSQAQTPPPTPKERIAILKRLRAEESRAKSSRDRDRIAREQAEHCIALGEEAYKAWYGRDEQDWIDRLGLIDEDIQRSLEWLSKHDPAREIQMSGTMSRYWWSIGKLDENRHWLVLSKDQSLRGHDLTKARALTGLSLSYLGLDKSRAETGTGLALEALGLYQKHGDLWGQAQVLRHLALHQHSLGQNVEALRNYRTALDLYKRVDSEPGQALTYQCMTAIMPVDSSGSATDADVLGWALEESRLYRKIRNPRGTSEGQETLMLIARDTPTPITSETRPLLEQVEGECREWLRLAFEQHVVRQQRALWLTLANVALKIGDKHTMAESLPVLIGTRPPTKPPVGYRGKVVGAYLRYRHLDLHPETNPVISKEFFRSGADSPSELARWNSYVDLGRHMSLEEAVRYAISN